MNIKEKIQRHIIGVCVIVIIILASVIAIAYKNNKKYEIVSNNSYNSAFYELVDNMNDVENYLLKAIVTTDSKQSAETLIYIWRDAGLALNYLSQIPISNEGLSNTQKFLNQVSEYSYTLSMKNLEGDSLTKEELNRLQELYKFSTEVNSTIGQIMAEMNDGTLSWKELKKDGSSLFEKDMSNDSIEGFNSIEKNFEEYDGLIYDGAYSEHITNAERKGLTGEDVDDGKAKQIAEALLQNFKSIDSKGFSENGNIKVFSFEIITNEENKVNVGISQKGGHIVYMNLDRQIEEKKISMEDAENRAVEFLNSNGFSNMQKTYYIEEQGIVTINYAYEEDNVIIYPDLIKVKVALDNGEILGLETTGYLNNHEKRNLDKSNIIGVNTAMKSINEDLEVTNTRLAMIPTKYRTEIFCWELKGKVEEKDFLVYVNAQTGVVEDILLIVDTGNGTLTQ